MRQVNGIARPPVLVITQPLRSIAWPVVLCNSIHSSAVLAAVPLQATSLITTAKGGSEAGVGVEVGGKPPLELACLGVPLRGAPLASRPFRMRALLPCQFPSLSIPRELTRSILT